MDIKTKFNVLLIGFAVLLVMNAFLFYKITNPEQVEHLQAQTLTLGDGSGYRIVMDASDDEAGIWLYSGEGNSTVAVFNGEHTSPHLREAVPSAGVGVYDERNRFSGILIDRDGATFQHTGKDGRTNYLERRGVTSGRIIGDEAPRIGSQGLPNE